MFREAMYGMDCSAESDSSDSSSDDDSVEREAILETVRRRRLLAYSILTESGSRSWVRRAPKSFRRRLGRTGTTTFVEKDLSASDKCIEWILIVSAICSR